MGIKIWVDDMRPAPEGYHWCTSVDKTISLIKECLYNDTPIDIIDMDHDSGDYYYFGGDFIKVLDWMEETGYCPAPIHIHSQNSVGVANMRAIIEHNHWIEK